MPGVAFTGIKSSHVVALLFWSYFFIDQIMPRHIPLVKIGMVSFLLIQAAALAASSNVSDDLRSLALELNKSTPLQIDREKKLELVVAVSNTIIFKYKFTDEAAIQSPNFIAQKYSRAVQAALEKSTCADDGLYGLMRQRARFNYVMMTAAGEKIVDLTLDQTLCANYRKQVGLAI